MIYAQREVVEEVEDPQLQISLEEAHVLNPSYKLGDMVDFVVTPKNFGRISAQTAKQVVVQKFREAEREILYNQYITKEKEIVIVSFRELKRRMLLFRLEKLMQFLHQMNRFPVNSTNLWTE